MCKNYKCRKRAGGKLNVSVAVLLVYSFGSAVVDDARVVLIGPLGHALVEPLSALLIE